MGGDLLQDGLPGNHVKGIDYVCLKQDPIRARGLADEVLHRLAHTFGGPWHPNTRLYRPEILLSHAARGGATGHLRDNSA